MPTRFGSQTVYRSACLFLLFLIPCLVTLSPWAPPSWRPPLFECSAFLLAALTLGPKVVKGSLRLSPGVLPFLLMVLWGAAQLAFHLTVYRFPTELSVLQGLALFCLFWSARLLLEDRSDRDLYLTATLVFAVVATAADLVATRLPVSTLSYLTPTTDIPNPLRLFASYNVYAQFGEVFIPIAIWQAFRARRENWAYAAAGLLLAAVVLYRGSRMGSALALLEVLAVVLVALPPELRRRSAPWLAGGAVALLAGLVYWINLRRGLLDTGVPLGYRPQMSTSAFHIWQDHWLTGVGMGNFETVYRAYANYDIGLQLRHAHNDPMEALADGGVVFGGLIVWLAVAHMRALARSPWAFGLAALCLHALTDFPFHNNSVVVWAVVLLGALAPQRRRKATKGPLPR